MGSFHGGPHGGGGIGALHPHAERRLGLHHAGIRTEIRGEAKSIPNLNVLFEYGYFLSVFGRRNVAVVRYGDAYLPSDLSGVIPISGPANYVQGRPRVLPARTKDEFQRWAAGFDADPRPARPSPSLAPLRTPADRTYRLSAKVNDVAIIESIDHRTRLRFSLTRPALEQHYVFEVHFRTSENERGSVGITNQAQAKDHVGMERTYMETREARPDTDINVLRVIHARYPELKGIPVLIDRLRLLLGRQARKKEPIAAVVAFHEVNRQH